MPIFKNSKLTYPKTYILRAILDYFGMAVFLQKLDHIHQAVNYFTTIEEAEWFWPEKVGTSLFECIQKAKGDEKKFEVLLDSYVKELVDFLKVHFSDICNREDAVKMLSGLESGSEVDLYAAATIESWKIILIELVSNCEKIGETVFDSKTSSKTVELLKLNAFYAFSQVGVSLSLK
jgi:hypothetical protein